MVWVRQTSIISRHLPNLATAACSTEWAHRQDQWEGNDYLVVPFEGGGSALFYNVINFGRDFLSLRITIFSGIKNYPNAIRIHGTPLLCYVMHYLVLKKTMSNWGEPERAPH